MKKLIEKRIEKLSKQLEFKINNESNPSLPKTKPLNTTQSSMMLLSTTNTINNKISLLKSILSSMLSSMPFDKPKQTTIDCSLITAALTTYFNNNNKLDTILNELQELPINFNSFYDLIEDLCKLGFTNLTLTSIIYCFIQYLQSKKNTKQTPTHIDNLINTNYNKLITYIISRL